uniref:Folate_rec domain-containing protein n=1 Tax=Macrostomum lignano TaxID=282301 RepID=A0A1I8IZE2_9PLAT
GLLICFSLTAFAVLASVDQPYCTFFGNRAPAPQPTLHNCTWYRQHSCCRGEESTSPLPACGLCRAPRVAAFAISTLADVLHLAAPRSGVLQGESLTVCRDFCDKWYRPAAAPLSRCLAIRNGYKLCDSRQFKVSTARPRRLFPLRCEEGEVFADRAEAPVAAACVAALLIYP